jgi:hypothetical protein
MVFFVIHEKQKYIFLVFIQHYLLTNYFFLRLFKYRAFQPN